MILDFGVVSLLMSCNWSQAVKSFVLPQDATVTDVMVMDTKRDRGKGR
jgi:hypothetical protein